MSASNSATQWQKWILGTTFMVALTAGLVLASRPPAPDPVAMITAPPPTETATATVTSTATAEPSDTPLPSATPTGAPTGTSTTAATSTITLSVRDTSTPVPTGTSEPSQLPTQAANPTSGSLGRFTIGGVNFARASEPLQIRYPTDWDQTNWLILEGVDILLSDPAGANLRIFNDIGSWVPAHKIFVYADSLTGVPILSIHDGYWARRPLEAEPLRELLEGAVRAPHALDVIEGNLQRLRGHPMVFGQAGSEARFVVRDALRMDAATTDAYLYKPGRLSELFPEGEVTHDTLVVLICSTRQPDEPDETFPARFLILLAYAPE